MIYIVVVEEHPDLIFIPFGSRIKVFSDPDKALNYAQEMGYEDPLGMGLNIKPGIMNQYVCGEYKVGILVQDSLDE